MAFLSDSTKHSKANHKVYSPGYWTYTGYQESNIEAFITNLLSLIYVIKNFHLILGKKIQYLYKNNVHSGEGKFRCSWGTENQKNLEWLLNRGISGFICYQD